VAEMRRYREGKFRNHFERKLFQGMEAEIAWCRDFVSKGRAKAFEAGVFHNVQTLDFHGPLSSVPTFGSPQSREIDILVEIVKPRQVRLLTSLKDHSSAISVDHVGDIESLLSVLRNDVAWCYLGMVVARHGFQSGCEESAKRGDCALVPPITGNTEWHKLITEEEILERTRDALRALLLFGCHWLPDQECGHGDFYNEVYVLTREPSGLHGKTKVMSPSARQVSMKSFVEAALAKPANAFPIPISGGRVLHPLFDPVEIISVNREGKQVTSRVRSIVKGRATGIEFYRVRTESGREIISDGQRALYIIDDYGLQRLVRVDTLRVGAAVLVADDAHGSKTERATVVELLDKDDRQE